MTVSIVTSPQFFEAHLSAEMRVESGSNLGDPLGLCEDLALDDIYVLDGAIAPRRLGLIADETGQLMIAQDSDLGTPGRLAFIDCCLTLMSSDGDEIDVMVLVETDQQGIIGQIFALPISPIAPQKDYSLIRIAQTGLRRKLAQIASVAFARGTRITTSTGAQVPIEDLQIGDRILTRDAGVQPLRFVLRRTARACGDLSPVRLHPGALNNAAELIVSPDHRLMVYQRSNTLGAGTSEVLVRARDLVNGETVTSDGGGFVEYFQLLFDQHHIIYAEGIAAESLFLDPITQFAIPQDTLDRLPARTGRAQRRDDHGTEIGQNLLNRSDAVAVLKRASLR